MAYENIRVTREDSIAVVQLNRPQVMNALNAGLMTELGDAVDEIDRDPSVGCSVIHGSERAFSAGADVEQMRSATPLSMLENDWISRNFARLRRATKPLLAAVSGYCLGGGCELAMTCDLIIAADTAQFGQPEINIGVIPGAGGTQRLAWAIGKARAMELILTGKFMDAQEAERRGLVARVVPAERYLEEAKSVARTIASKSPVAVRLAKEAVNKVYELPLEQALEYEGRLFSMLFSTEDQKEGMDAFLTKRKPVWKGK